MFGRFSLLSALTKPMNPGGDFCGAVGALDCGGVDEEVDGSVAATADLDDVAKSGTLQAGNDSDAVGERGKWALPIEEAFAAETLFEFLGSREESAKPCLLHGFGDELELAAGFVDGERAGDADGIAIFGTEAEEGGLAAEKDDGELGFGVL